MRVAFAVEVFRRDGIAAYCLRLARALPCEVVLVTSASELPDDSVLDAFDDVVFRDRPLRGPSPANVIGLASTLRRRRVDVLHVHELSLLGSLSPAARLAGVRVVGTSHLGRAGSASFNPVAKRVFALGAGALLADAYIAISSEIEAQLRDGYRLPPNRIRKVLSGVDLTRFRPPTPVERSVARDALGVPASATLFLQLGRLTRIKRPLDTLEAFAALRGRRGDGELRLLFAGDGPGRAALEADVARLGSGDAVIVAGFVDARTALWASDALVLPSSVEGFPLVVIEAMACGVVPVRSRVEGFDDQIVEGVDGLGFDAGDVAALGARLETLLDASVRRRLGAAALASARERFDIERTARAVHRLYRTLVRGDGSRR